jgi:5-hydroxyisourate hydrolase-like protein (transthyretin family)
MLAVAPSPAHAGSYVLVGCADLAGALGPGHVARPADGWFLERGVYPSRQDCAAGRSGRGIYATGSQEPNLFRLDAPPGTTISRLVLTYRAHLSGAAEWAVPTFVVQAGHGGGWEYIDPARGYIGADPIDFGGDRAVADAHGADALRLGTRCDLRGPCVEGGQPAARFHALAVVLRDDRAPNAAIGAPGGHVRGTLDLPVGATDEGGGVFERTVSVDGHALAGGALCRTVPASVGPMRHVVRRVPCPLDAPAHVRLDTRTLADGRHELAARAEDVAGNARTAEAAILVDNRPPVAGTVGLAGEAAVSEALTAEPTGFAGEDVAYAYRWQRCDAAGEGCAELGGAVERTYALRPGDAGHRVRAVVSATDGGGSVQVASVPSAVVADRGTGPSGGFSAAAPSAPAGRLTAWLERGRRRLHAATVRWPTRVRIRGRLTDRSGRPLPRTAVRMLERVDGRRWRAITGVRTRRDGRLTAFTRIGPSRHLRLVYGRASANLRLRVRATARVSVRRAGALTLVSGRLLGGRVPPAGVRVRLQARDGSRWSTRATLRTDGLGRFSATGRAPAGVRLRIAIPTQAGYPFARGVAHP